MTKIPIELINNWNILRTRWYYNFIPKCKVKSFQVNAWKVASISTGQDPQHPILLKRLSDGKNRQVGYSDIEESFISEEQYINLAESQDFQLHDKNETGLHFIV